MPTKKGHLGSTEPQARRVLDEIMGRPPSDSRKHLVPPAPKKDEQVVRPRKDPNS